MWSLFVLELRRDLLIWVNHCRRCGSLWRQKLSMADFLATWRFNLTYRTVWRPRQNQQKGKGLLSHRALSSSCCKQARPTVLWSIMVNADFSYFANCWVTPSIYGNMFGHPTELQWWLMSRPDIGIWNLLLLLPSYCPCLTCLYECE